MSKNDDVHVIPPNFEENAVTSSGKSVRNIIEGAIFFIAVSGIIFLLPIHSLRIKIILSILIGGSAGLFGVIGISHYSVTEFLMLFFRFKRQQKNIAKKEMFYQEDSNIN